MKAVGKNYQVKVVVTAGEKSWQQEQQLYKHCLDLSQEGVCGLGGESTVHVSMCVHICFCK